jgi:hypothetical protein
MACVSTSSRRSIGAVTDAEGYSAGISDPADKRVFGLLRMTCDALMVGAGTLRHEGYGALRLGERREDGGSAHGLRRTLAGDRVGVRRPRSASAVFTDAHRCARSSLTTSSAPPERRAALAEVARRCWRSADATVTCRGASTCCAGWASPDPSEGGPYLLGALTAADPRRRDVPHDRPDPGRPGFGPHHAPA